MLNIIINKFFNMFFIFHPLISHDYMMSLLIIQGMQKQNEKK